MMEVLYIFIIMFLNFGLSSHGSDERALGNDELWSKVFTQYGKKLLEKLPNELLDILIYAPIIYIVVGFWVRFASSREKQLAKIRSLDTVKLTVFRNGKTYGPYSYHSAIDHIDSGLLSPSDLCWNETEGQWAPISEVIKILKID